MTNYTHYSSTLTKMNPFLLNKADPESAHECVVGAVLWVLGWCGNGYSCVKTQRYSRRGPLPRQALR